MKDWFNLSHDIYAIIFTSLFLETEIIILMLKQTIAELLTQAVARAQQEGKLPTLTLPEIVIERPQKPEHGDYASSISLKLARAAGTSPMNIASEIADCMSPAAEIESVTVAPPGFINFTLKNDWLTGQVDNILEKGDSYGNIFLGDEKPIQIEFVSINPTGPLHVGHGRGAVLGSTLCNIMTASGYRVVKEYYFNDAGSQMDSFRNSLWARYRQALGRDAEMPADGYLGNYMVDLAAEITKEEGDRFTKMPEAEGIEELGKIGLAKILDGTREDLKKLRVDFDVWYSEKTLYENGQFDKVMKLLKQGGYIAEKEGATWFVSTALGPRRRQRQCGRAGQRLADLLRRRYRLSLQQVHRAQVRPRYQYLGRRPHGPCITT